MNTRAAGFAALACALLGGWLPSLWLASKPAAKPLPLTAPPAGPSSPAAGAAAPSPNTWENSMAMLRKVVDGTQKPPPGFPAMEELSRMIAGEAAGRKMKDPAAFLKMLERQDGDFQYAALQGWADTDPDTALTFLMTEGRPYRFTHDALRRLTAQNPEKALGLLRAVPAGPGLNHVWDAVLTGLTDKNPTLALQALQSNPGFPVGELWNVVREFAQRDPSAALAWVKSLPEEMRGKVGVKSVLGKLAEQDPAAALQEWEKTKGKEEPPFEILYAWSEKDPDGLLQWALRQQPPCASALNYAAGEITWRDPDKALQMLSRLPAGARKDALSAIGSALAGRDPQTALTWMRSLPAEERSEVQHNLIPNISRLSMDERKALATEAGLDTVEGFIVLFETARPDAEKVFATLPPAASLAISRTMVARRTETSAADAAPFASVLARALADPAFAAALPRGNQSSDAFAGGDNDTDSPSASAGFDESADKSEAESAAREARESITEDIARVTTAWAALDPPAVAAWVTTLPAGQAQTAAAANLAIAWARYDLPAARAWVEQLPAGETKNQAVEQVARFDPSASPPAE